MGLVIYPVRNMPKRGVLILSEKFLFSLLLQKPQCSFRVRTHRAVKEKRALADELANVGEKNRLSLAGLYNW